MVGLVNAVRQHVVVGTVSNVQRKAQAFFEKKKEETKGKMKDGDKKSPDTSKMPEGLRKHFERRTVSPMTSKQKAQEFFQKKKEAAKEKCGCKHSKGKS